MRSGIEFGSKVAGLGGAQDTDSRKSYAFAAYAIAHNVESCGEPFAPAREIEPDRVVDGEVALDRAARKSRKDAIGRAK